MKVEERSAEEQQWDRIRQQVRKAPMDHWRCKDADEPPKRSWYNAEHGKVQAIVKFYREDQPHQKYKAERNDRAAEVRTGGVWHRASGRLL